MFHGFLQQRDFLRSHFFHLQLSLPRFFRLALFTLFFLALSARFFLALFTGFFLALSARFRLSLFTGFFHALSARFFLALSAFFFLALFFPYQLPCMCELCYNSQNGSNSIKPATVGKIMRKSFNFLSQLFFISAFQPTGKFCTVINQRLYIKIFLQRIEIIDIHAIHAKRKFCYFQTFLNCLSNVSFCGFRATEKTAVRTRFKVFPNLSSADTTSSRKQFPSGQGNTHCVPHRRCAVSVPRTKFSVILPNRCKTHTFSLRF